MSPPLQRIFRVDNRIIVSGDFARYLGVRLSILDNLSFRGTVNVARSFPQISASHPFDKLRTGSFGQAQDRHFAHNHP
jgi:hypothetical protein